MPTAKDLILKPVRNLSVMQSIIEPTMKLMRKRRTLAPILATAPKTGIPLNKEAIPFVKKERGETNNPLKTISIPNMRATNIDVLKSLISKPGSNFDNANITRELTRSCNTNPII